MDAVAGAHPDWRTRERDKLQKKLATLNDRIAQISGGTIPGAGIAGTHPIVQMWIEQ